MFQFLNYSQYLITKIFISRNNFYTSYYFKKNFKNFFDPSKNSKFHEIWKSWTISLPFSLPPKKKEKKFSPKLTLKFPNPL